MNKRINISLPEETVRLIDRAVPKGERSQLIDEAVRLYISKIGRTALRKRLAEGYRRNASQDVETAAEWFAAGEDAWRKHER